MHYGECSICHTWTDVYQEDFCLACIYDKMNQVIHTCRGCKREYTRFDGMHATVLEPDGNLELQVRHVRSGPDEPWREEFDMIERVLCAECCPAETHNDDQWCRILWPHTLSQEDDEE